MKINSIMGFIVPTIMFTIGGMVGCTFSGDSPKKNDKRWYLAAVIELIFTLGIIAGYNSIK